MKQIMTFICFFILGLFLMRSTGSAEVCALPQEIETAGAALYQEKSPACFPGPSLEQWVI